MPALAFPPGFLWGAATSAYQVEGGNAAADWWDWERIPGTPCREQSGAACEHYSRYPQDVALLASLGLNAYRFGVEWARVEPAEGAFDREALDHYRQMAECVVSNGMTPIVTLHHFSLPRWLGSRGGWTANKTPALFERYCRRVVDALGPGVPWFVTINEPASVATGGYVGRWGFPPGVVDPGLWRRAIEGLLDGHHRAMGVVRDLRPAAKAGLGLYSAERIANSGGRPAMEFVRRMNEDVYLEAAAEDDFVGVQTYTRLHYRLPRRAGLLTRAALAIPPLRDAVTPTLMALPTGGRPGEDTGAERPTQMGWGFFPEAVAAVVRRVAARYPDKDIVVTEHGVATDDDAERVEYLRRGVAALHATLADGVRLRGYVHWSALDNFEWASGYRPKFGLVEVDRATQARTARPSARLLGNVARTGCLELDEGGEAAP